MACPAETLAPVQGDPMMPQPFGIKWVRRNTRDTFTLELAPANGAESAMAASGQFNMLYVFGVGEVPISISSAPGRALLHTTRAVGTVTRAMARLKRGDMVGVRGPFGSSWPLEEARGKDVVIIAGGIGMAPLRGALLELVRRRKRYGRIVLIYGARTPADVLYERELERLRERGLDLSITVDRAVGAWRGHVGVVTTLIPRAPFNPHNCVALMCGPEIMMRFATRELQKGGVPDAAIFLSLERNMKCAVGFCGHCQFGPEFICKDGPVFRYDRVARWLGIREL
jgi:NAD(P)H-flavin reductase